MKPGYPDGAIMEHDEDDNYRARMKKAWIIYALLTLLLILILVFFVARDNEEKLFYSLMTAAAAYVFRPTERFMKRQIDRFTGTSSQDEK